MEMDNTQWLVVFWSLLSSHSLTLSIILLQLQLKIIPQNSQNKQTTFAIKWLKKELVAKMFYSAPSQPEAFCKNEFLHANNTPQKDFWWRQMKLIAHLSICAMPRWQALPQCSPTNQFMQICVKKLHESRVLISYS